MSYKVEKIHPYNAAQGKKEQVTHMFNEIALRYDLMNGALSLGIDDYWRSDALKELRKYRPQHILDIATGTGDFAIMAHRILHPEKVTAVDIAEGMMGGRPAESESKRAGGCHLIRIPGLCRNDLPRQQFRCRHHLLRGA